MRKNIDVPRGMSPRLRFATEAHYIYPEDRPNELVVTTANLEKPWVAVDEILEKLGISQMSIITTEYSYVHDEKEGQLIECRMSNNVNADRWNDDWQPPLIQNIIHQQVIEDLAVAEKWGVPRQVQIDHTVKALNLLEERLDALKYMQKFDKIRARDGR